MILLIVLQTPLWTDVIQAFGVGLGLPITFWGVINLFLKDKQKQLQIETLTQIAQSQNSIIDEMRKQLSEFVRQTQEMEYQTILMKDSNDLFKEQISLQAQAISHDEAYRERILIMETSKRKSENRPYFVFSRGVSSPSDDSYSITFKNVGKTAYFRRIVDAESNDIVYLNISPREEAMINQNQEIIIGGSIKDSNQNINFADFEFTFEYQDILGTIYQQSLTKKNRGQSFIVGKPVEIEEL